MNLAESIESVEALVDKRRRAITRQWPQTVENNTALAAYSARTDALETVLKAAKAAQKLFAQEPTKPTKK